MLIASAARQPDIQGFLFKEVWAHYNKAALYQGLLHTAST